MDQENRYFLAIIPSEPIYSLANNLKIHLKDKYNTKAALNSPPHITLHMPFRIKQKKESELVTQLNKTFQNREAFNMRLSGFGHFDERVLFINVFKTQALQDLTTDLKNAMKRSFNIFNADYKSRGFNPHLTIAFRDLKKKAFNEAWEELQSTKFEEEAEVAGFSLLKHDGSKWEECQKVNF